MVGGLKVYSYHNTNIVCFFASFLAGGICHNLLDIVENKRQKTGTTACCSYYSSINFKFVLKEKGTNNRQQKYPQKVE